LVQLTPYYATEQNADGLAASALADNPIASPLDATTPHLDDEPTVTKEVEEYSYQSRPLPKAFLFEIVANKRNGMPSDVPIVC
jgi:hypothetical protein